MIRAQDAKRVMWAEGNSCRSLGFAPEEQSKLLMSCDSWVSNDATLQIIQVNDLTVTTVIGDDGDYIIADTYVTNKTDNRMLVDPYQSVLFAWKSADVTQTPERLQPISGQEIASKLKNHAKWANLIGGILASIATNTSTVTSTTNGSFSGSGSYGGSFFSASGLYSGTTTSTITTPDLVARMQEQVRARERSENAAKRGSYYVTNAMKANTLFARQSSSGIIYFHRKKAPVAVFTIRINDILFDFPSPRPTASGIGTRSNTKPIPVPDLGLMRGDMTAQSPALVKPIPAPSMQNSVLASDLPAAEVAKPGSALPSSGEGFSDRPLPPKRFTGESAKQANTHKWTISGMDIVWIPAGSFTMGGTDGESDERPAHRVTLTDGFWMGAHEVTQLEWFAVMGTNPSSFTRCGKDCPVENVSWDDVQSFLAKLNEKNDGFVYSLPTEAQWEYAARAGSISRAPAAIDDAAWSSKNSGGAPHAVGTKRPNAFGLYDMNGNVWEWCSDWYGKYEDRGENDPTGPAKGKLKVIRGGAWKDGTNQNRYGYRSAIEPGKRDNNTGFRVVARVR